MTAFILVEGRNVVDTGLTPVIGPGPHQAYKTHSCGGEECRGYWSDPRDRAWASSGL